MRLPFLLVAALLVCGAANAAFQTGFEAVEGYVGSPGGTAATYGFGGGGQMGWYNPVSGSADANIYTYGGNVLGLPVNTTGGEQFLGGIAGPNGAYVRAQHSATYWTGQNAFAYDLCATFLGDMPSAQNLGSVSLQDSATTKSFIALNVWVDPNNPFLGWNVQYNVFDAAGAALNNQSPGAAWNNLLLSNWYRQSTTFNFVTNQITKVTLVDLTTGVKSVAFPTGWYLQGGANSVLPIPTGLRFFIGGNTPTGGNTMGYDNLSIVPEPGLTGLAAFGVLALLKLRRKK